MDSTEHNPIDTPGPDFEDEISVSANVRESSENVKDKKVKTEPANPFLQFWKAKKKENPGIALNSKLIREQWAGLEDNERNVYINLYKSEKESLGADYRKDRKRKLKNSEVTKLLKTKQNSAHVSNLDKGRKCNKVSNSETEQEEDTIESLLNELEKLDDIIDIKIVENDNLKDEISIVSADLAVKRNTLAATTESYLSFQTKYEDVIKKHKNCYTS